MEVQACGLPITILYGIPDALQYDDERIEQRDFEYMKSMYPETAKRLLPYVEDECDRMAYEGSVVYDEYPDQLQMRMMCRRIYDRVKELDGIEPEEMQMEAQEHMGIRRRRKEDWLGDMIQIMVYQELFRRRCDHRKCRRNFYF